VVSLAAALALPEAFPGRDFIVATTFAVILVTVLVQGATLAPLIRALRLSGFTLTSSPTLPEASARARMAAAQLTEVERHSASDGKTHRHPRLVEQYSYRARAAARFSLTSPTEGVGRRQGTEIPGTQPQRSALQGMIAHATSRLFRALIFGGG